MSQWEKVVLKSHFMKSAWNLKWFGLPFYDFSLNSIWFHAMLCNSWGKQSQSKRWENQNDWSELSEIIALLCSRSTIQTPFCVSFSAFAIAFTCLRFKKLCLYFAFILPNDIQKETIGCIDSHLTNSISFHCFALLYFTLP